MEELAQMNKINYQSQLFWPWSGKVKEEVQIIIIIIEEEKKKQLSKYVDIVHNRITTPTVRTKYVSSKLEKLSKIKCLMTILINLKRKKSKKYTNHKLKIQNKRRSK